MFWKGELVMTEDNFISHVEYKHKLQDCLNKFTGFKHFHSSQQEIEQCEPDFRLSGLRFPPFPHFHLQSFPPFPCTRFLFYICQRSVCWLQFLLHASTAPFVSLDGVCNEKVKGHHWKIQIMLESLWMYKIWAHPCNTTNYLEFGSIISPRRSTGGSTTLQHIVGEQVKNTKSWLRVDHVIT